MKKILVLFPTFLLILIFLIGIWLQGMGQKIGIDLVVFGVAGIFVYAPVTIFISGLTELGKGNFVKWKQTTTNLRMYYIYLVMIWAIDIIIAMYFMNHN